MFARRTTLFAVVALALLGAACDADDGRELPEPGPDQTLTIVTTPTTVEALPGEEVATEEVAETVDPGPMEIGLPWEPGGVIPIDHTCEGADRSPAITWGQLPSGTVEVAISVTDLTAGEFVHWVVFGLDPNEGGVAEDASATAGAQAINDFGTALWGGPCPPSDTHTYRFTVHALGQQLETPSGVSAAETLTAIASVELESASSTGTFTAS